MSGGEIFICFACGAKNRVPAGRLSSASCGKCKKSLIEASENTSPQTSANSSKSPRDAANGAEKSRVNPWKVMFIAAALLGAGYLFTSGQANRPSNPYTFPSTKQASRPEKPPKNEPLPPVVFQTPGVMWNYTGRSGNAPFTIITRSGSDYYIKLVDYYSGADRVGIFVSGGRTLNVRIPPGSYKLRYAYGKSWRGEKVLFGPGRNTQYQQSPTRFDFMLNSGYTVELISQAGGNMPTSGISASQF